MAPFIHVDPGVTSFDGLEDLTHVAGRTEPNVPEVEVVGGSDQDGRDFLRGVLRIVEVGGHPDPIPHRDHQLPFDDRDLGQLVLGCPPTSAQFGLGSLGRRLGDGGDEGNE